MRIREGDPLEIYTSKEGEVIFKKYSLMGGLSDFASQLCETLHKTSGHPTIITDRDTIIAVSGLSKRELMEKRVSAELEALMEGRQIFQYHEGQAPVPLSETNPDMRVLTAAPILTEGDVMGCVALIGSEDSQPMGDAEYKLAQAFSGFLGKHMES